MSLRRAMQTENWAIFSAEKQNQALRAIRRHMVQVDRLNKYLVATKLDGDPIKLRRFTELTIRSVVRHILKLDAIVISLETVAGMCDELAIGPDSYVSIVQARHDARRLYKKSVANLREPFDQ